MHLDDSVTNRKVTELGRGEWTHQKSSLLSLPPTRFIFHFTVFKCLVDILLGVSFFKDWMEKAILPADCQIPKNINSNFQRKTKKWSVLHWKETREANDDNWAPTSPDDRTLFMYSKNDSSLISLSVKMKVTPLPCWPAVLYRAFRSSIRFAVL